MWAARFACLHGPLQERERERARTLYGTGSFNGVLAVLLIEI